LTFNTLKFNKTTSSLVHISGKEFSNYYQFQIKDQGIGVV